MQNSLFFQKLIFPKTYKIAYFSNYLNLQNSLSYIYIINSLFFQKLTKIAQRLGALPPDPHSHRRLGAQPPDPRL